MPNLLKLPTWSKDNLVHVVVETPRNARAKLKFDPELRTFILAKSLLLGLTYPFDWGFIPSTVAEDGDPLDVMVIHEAATTPGLVMKCRVIGILEATQKNGNHEIRNDRIFAVPDSSRADRDIQDVKDLTPETREELQKFFQVTDALQHKSIKFLDWRGPKEAERIIQKGEKRFAKG